MTVCYRSLAATGALLVAMAATAPAFAAGDIRTVVSSDAAAMVHAARVVKVENLVDKSHVQVNFVVVDTGGSTDVSPTQKLYFTAYMKGEVFSTDLSFDLGPIYAFVGAKRLDRGRYEVRITRVGKGGFETIPWIIDARDALVAMKKVRCPDFDCKASTDFKAQITVQGSPIHPQ